VAGPKRDRRRDRRRITSGDVDATGVTVTATANNVIDALGVAAAVGVSGAGGVAISLSGSAVLATNTLTNLVEAGITGGADVDANSVAIAATDSSAIDSTLVSASVSVGGAVGFALNLSLALSIAEVNWHVTRAVISGSDVTATSGA
jgi:hypothetical protein